VTLGAQRIVDRLAGLQRGAEHAGVGADRQRVLVLIEAACRYSKCSWETRPGCGEGAATESSTLSETVDH
jgi:hypothetical protein